MVVQENDDILTIELHEWNISCVFVDNVKSTSNTHSDASKNFGIKNDKNIHTTSKLCSFPLMASKHSMLVGQLGRVNKGSVHISSNSS